MQLLGVGVDIVELRRVADARYLDRVADFLFLPEELNVFRRSRDRVQFVASRLSAKEAVIKAFPGILRYHDFMIHTEATKPAVRFVDMAHQYQVLLSITHEEKYAASVAALCSRA